MSLTDYRMSQQYCNELSMTIELDSTLAQAEVLFLSFAQLVADIDRRRAEEESLFLTTSGTAQLRKRSTTGGAGSVTSDEASQSSRRSIGLPVIADNLRELLSNQQPTPTS